MVCVVVLLVTMLAHTGTVYAQSNSEPVFNASDYTFYTLPDVDGSSTTHTVGIVAATDSDSGDTVTYGLRASDPADRMYMVGDSTDALYHVDSDDFTATRVDISITAFGVGETNPTGIAWHNSRLYMVGAANDALYTLDPDTGRAARVGSGVSEFGVDESLPQDLASHNGVLYMLGNENDTLYELNPETGTARQVGTVAQFGQSLSNPTALTSFGSPAGLYALFEVEDAALLYRLDTTSGIATGIANASAPDGSDPAAMTVHDSKLYAVGSTPTRVWEQQISSDTVTVVNQPISDDFGVGETSPSGMTTGYTQPSDYSIDSSTGTITYTGNSVGQGVDTLYAQARDSKDGSGVADTDWDTAAAVTVNAINRTPEFGEHEYSYTLPSTSDGSVTPIAVGTPTATDPENQTLTYSLRASDPTEDMYMLGQSTGALHILDSTTGVAAKRVGTTMYFGVNERLPYGLDWHNGQLYMLGRGTNSLYTLDVVTGEATRIVSGGPGVLSGVASNRGELYVTKRILSTNKGGLYRVDPDTLTFTQIGEDNFGVGEVYPRGIASHGSPAELYMIGGSKDTLYTLDVITGEADRVGAVSEFGVAENSPVGLASHNDSLYMTGQGNGWLYTLDTATGAATRVGSSDGFGVGESSPRGIASGYRVPEGFTIDSATGEITYTGGSDTGGSATGGSVGPGVYVMYVRVSDGKNSANADDTSVDDMARVVVTVLDPAPVFTRSSYEFTILPGTDGSDTAKPVGTVTAIDPEDDTVSYSLYGQRATDSSEHVYMVGNTNNALYTIDITTSEATRIGNADRFDAGITNAAGLTWHHDKLYMIGGTASQQDGIYTIDTTSGTATRTARLADFGVGYRPMSAIASHGGILYALSSHNNTGRLFKIDLQTNTATQLGSNNFGSTDEKTPTGLASHNGRLYMVGTHTDRLHDIDPTTGAATPIGSATMFDTPDGGENTPSGLTSHNTTLYMIGTDKNRLYTLNTTTGTATPTDTTTSTTTPTNTTTGTATPTDTTTSFGVSENNPQGITSGYAQPAGYSIDSSTGAIFYTGGPVAKGIYTLYVQARDHRASSGSGTSHAVDATVPVTVTVTNRAPEFTEHEYSYTLTPTSDDGAAPVAVGTPTATDPENQTLTYSLRSSDPPEGMYMLGDSTNALYTLDTTTGQAAQIGTTTRFGVGETEPRGLSWHNGQLYMIGNDANGLYTLDTVTGEATPITNNEPGTLYGVASHRGELYVTADSSFAAMGRLYRVDLDTLAFTQIGEDNFGVGEVYPRGIASHGSPAQLYMLGSFNRALYTLDADTGIAVRVGAANSFGVTELFPFGLASHAGSLYMTGAYTGALYVLDAATGEATSVGSSHEFGVGERLPLGIASGYRVPEGFTIDSATGEITYTGGSDTGGSAGPGGSDTDVSVGAGVYVMYVRVSDGKNSANADDPAVDDMARVVVTVLDPAPVFTQSSYEFTILPDTDGSDTAKPVGTVTAIDPEDDTVSYSLYGQRATDSSEHVYMVGNTNNALYTIDITTSEATRIGNADRFDAGITNAAGLTWHHDKLYMIGGTASQQDGIYTIDTTSGTATRTARLADFGVGYRPMSAIASHGGILYALSSHNNTGRLFKIDLQTNTATQLGSNNFGSTDEKTPTGLASHNGRLYMVGTHTDRLHDIDPTTGAATPIGSATMFDTPDGGENTPSGLTSHNTTLYMIGTDKNRLYTLNTTTGTATPTDTTTSTTTPTNTTTGTATPTDTTTSTTTPTDTTTSFGVSENNPQGITSNTRVFTDVFTIDSSTGAISYTGSPATAHTEYILYVHVRDHRASSGSGTSYAVDATVPVTVTVTNRAPEFTEREYSYTLTPTSGSSAAPVAVGTPTATNPENQTLTYSLRSSDPPEGMYMLGDSTNALYTLDSTTGVATKRVGTTTRFGVGETEPRGLSWHNGQLYMTGNNANGLYTLDTVTGEATPITNNGPGTLHGVASHRGELYATTSTDDIDGTGRLYRVDLDTSTFTQIGEDDFGIGETRPRGIASHGSPAELYMLGDTTDALYTLDADTGIAARVGAADSFADDENNPTGLNENNPTGLTSHAGSLYMTGHDTGALYLLDTATGVVARVGSSHGFGVGESLPSGIASRYRKPEGFTIDAASGEISYTGVPVAPGAHILYAQVSDSENPADAADTAVDDIVRVIVTVLNQAPAFGANSYSYTLAAESNGSGIPVVVGTPAATDPENQTLAYSLRASDSAEDLYMAGGSADALYALDSVTGEAARVGAATRFGVNETDPAGLGWHNGRLYMIGGNTGGLYTVDIVTGEATLVAGKAQLTGTDSTQLHLSGVASHNSELYVTTSGLGRLYRVDMDTLRGTQTGGDNFGAVNETHPHAIASHGSPAELYMVGAFNDALYTLDGITGAASRVGGLDGFAADEKTPVGLVSRNGSLYMTGRDNTQLYRLDTVTGAASRVGTLDDFGVAETAPSGIAAGYTTPEDFSLDAATGEITYTGISAPHGVHTLYAQVSDNKNQSNTIDTATDDTTRVIVTTPNQAPEFTRNAYEFNILPDTDTVQPVGTVTATDPEDDPITYSLTYTPHTSDSSEPVFAINSDTGMITYIGSPVVTGTTYTLYAQASDGRNSQGSGTSSAIDTTATIAVTATADTADTPPPPEPQSQPQPQPQPQPEPQPQTQTQPEPQSQPQTQPQPQPQPRFADTAGLANESDIAYIAAVGITRGCDPAGRYYCPERPVTRAQIATLLTRAFKLQPPTSPTTIFHDIQNNHHKNSINAIAAVGITRGCDPAGRYYCPERPVTRAQIATLLTRAFKLQPPTSPTTIFHDIQNNHHKNSINATAAVGITRGCDPAGRYYCPERPVTRAQIATLLTRALTH